MIEELQKETIKLINKDKAKILQGFFKTKKGEYGEGDIFYGITVPKSREVAIKYKEMPLESVSKLLKSKVHEERLIALLILVNKFNRGNINERKEIFNIYLKSTKYINNWDLVDLSSEKIIGEFLIDSGDIAKLIKLSKSNSIWERRIAIISTFAFIKKGISKPTLVISQILLNDKEDLIHKAVGWMLREVGKRCSQNEEQIFLDKNVRSMPRTMLRYAIERFDQKLKDEYLQIK